MNAVSHFVFSILGTLLRMFACLVNLQNSSGYTREPIDNQKNMKWGYGMGDKKTKNRLE